MRELTSEELLKYEEIQPRTNDRLMTHEEWAFYLDNHYQNPRIQEINDRLQEINQEFISTDWKAHKIALGEWASDDERTIEYRAFRLALREEQDSLKLELNEL